MPPYNDGRLLLVLPLRAYAVKTRFFVDSQACNGLTLWLRHFSHVTLACPTEYPDDAPEDTSTIDSVEGADRLTFVSLPTAYEPCSFLARLPSAIRLLTELISKADYLHFAIGGTWGDWASVACLLARRANLPYAVWTDRVESQVVAFSSRSKTGIRRLYTLLNARLMQRYERYVIMRCALGLFHGMDCYRAYSPFCSNSHLVHDIHLGSGAQITPASLTRRLGRPAGVAMRIVYAGRVHSEKGVYDWIELLLVLAKKDIAFRATWFGAGPNLDDARRRVGELGLTSHIEFPGPTESHAQLIRDLKNYDVFVFCHKTLESPRNLIEALLCGLPIVGYETDYSRDLVHVHGGGLLTPIHDVEQVVNSLTLLSSDRSLLRRLSEAAAQDGVEFTDEKVFLHRSQLMKSIGTSASHGLKIP